MAPVFKVLRTSGFLIYLIVIVIALAKVHTEPMIVKLKVLRKNCDQINCNYLLKAIGGEFLGHLSWRLTPEGGSCDVSYPNYEISEVQTEQWHTKSEVTVSKENRKIYFCLRFVDKNKAPFSGNWIHQGEEIYLDPTNDEVGTVLEKILQSTETPDVQNTQVDSDWKDLSNDISVNYLNPKPRLTRKLYDIDISDPNTIIYKGVMSQFDESHKDLIGGIVKNAVIMNEKSLDRRKRDSLTTKPDNGEETLVTRQMTDVMETVKGDPMNIVVDGVRIEDSAKEPKITEGGVPSVLAGSGVTLRLFGDGLTPRTVIAFTDYPQEMGEKCKFILKGEYLVKVDTVTKKSAAFDITAPPSIPGAKLYLCVKNLNGDTNDLSLDEGKYIHQGTEPYKVIATHNTLLPLWVTLILILICLTFSALFSGLNLGLMSLDRTELKIISNTGTEQERKYARAIMPVRDHGNYLLCSILLGNVAVNSTFTILLDELTSGLFAVIFSTLAIVLLGEITPQAICSRHGLMVGAKSIVVTKAVMALTAPLAFPVSKLLDYFLGEEIGSVYNRERLKELVKVTTDVNDLDKDEVNIISGALELRKKTVSDVMTKLEDVFMLPITSVLDFETMSEIVKSGYSRIPVFEGSRTNIVTVLFIKDLAFVDPDDNTPLRTLCQYYQNPCNFVFEDVTLDLMFKQFKDGHKGHMAFVHRINNEGEGDPFYETIGLVTLEDVIEEMIQAEIVDETDVFMDNRTKRRRNRPQNKLQDFAAFAERHENQHIHISPQLTLATFQFLSTSVDAFRPDTVSETVLRRLLRQDVIQHIKLKGKTKKDPSTYVFQQGKPVDYFVLIVEGRVEVTVGRENLVFEAGPFTYFGVQALAQNVAVAESPPASAMGSLQNINIDAQLRHTFVPDYSVRAVTELFYLTVKRSLYLAAKRATLMEKGALSKGATNEQFDTEVDKHLCHSSSANIPISMISKKLLGKSTSTPTAYNPDDCGSCSNANKPNAKQINIIELLQVSPQNYPSSERLEADKYSTNSSKCIQNYAKCLPNISRQYDQHWPNIDKMANACDTTKSLANVTKSFSNDMFVKSMPNSCEMTRHEKDLDANVCDECVKNNYWLNKTILTKSIDGKSDTERIKKKTTFHTDSSLLTFHDLTFPDVDSAERSDFDRESIEKRTNFDRETVEKHTDFDREDTERKRDMDELVLMQLSKIIRLLERNQT
ncbi:unextended protein-like isoform X2 [Plodia interpunctella]|uniref:unextended protein-like isoform X2 n=1 Tax=Plodia interpunctella TaxID=58824 RepID=UPI0023687778|nr:unextended protein-like isoform X2 [Plodia interpunctella]